MTGNVGYHIGTLLLGTATWTDRSWHPSFGSDYPGRRRVQAKEMDECRPLSDNIENCVGYAFKFNHGEWSEYDSAYFWWWVRQRAALRAMCFLLEKKSSSRKISLL